jgi:hypothetical protein
MNNNLVDRFIAIAEGWSTFRYHFQGGRIHNYVVGFVVWSSIDVSNKTVLYFVMCNENDVVMFFYYFQRCDLRFIKWIGVFASTAHVSNTRVSILDVIYCI